MIKTICQERGNSRQEFQILVIKGNRQKEEIPTKRIAQNLFYWNLQWQNCHYRYNLPSGKQEEPRNQKKYQLGPIWNWPGKFHKKGAKAGGVILFKYDSSLRRNEYQRRANCPDWISDIWATYRAIHYWRRSIRMPDRSIQKLRDELRYFEWHSQ